MDTLAGLISRAGHDWQEFRAPKYAGQGPSFPISAVDDFLEYVSGGGGETWSGADISTSTAIKIAVVWRCINVRAGALGQLPLITYRYAEDGGKERARDHYLYRLLRYRVNPYMTAYRWKHLMETWLCQYGNAYSMLVVNGRGQVVEMWPWLPSRVEVKFHGGEPLYRYRMDDGTYVEQPWFNIAHLRGLSTDGFFGLSPVEAHRQTLGMAQAIQKHGAKFYSNGAVPRGVLQSPAGVTVKIDDVRANWERIHGGVDNSHKVAILTNGMEFKEIGMKNVDAQYIESNNLTVIDICRIYGVQPHKAFELTRSTNNNIEHQGIEFHTDELGPQIANYEEELNNILLSERERDDIVVEFLVDAMMRTDAKSRAEYYTKALGGAPWMVQNEARQKENFNPLSEESANKLPVTNNAPGQTNQKGQGDEKEE